MTDQSPHDEPAVKYRRVSESVYAIQFDPDVKPWPYWIREQPCQCRELAQDGRLCELHKPNGRRFGIVFNRRGYKQEVNSGEWIVTEPNGNRSVWSDKDFREMYAPIPTPAIDERPAAGELAGEQLHAIWLDACDDKYLAPWDQLLDSHKAAWDALAERVATNETIGVVALREQRDTLHAEREKLRAENVRNLEKIEAIEEAAAKVNGHLSQQITTLTAQLAETQAENARLHKANTPFEDADPQIEVFQHERGWWCYRVGGNECGPYQTWREAYRAAEGQLFWQQFKAAEAQLAETVAERDTFRELLARHDGQARGGAGA